jgi:hypothetical protein
MIPQILLLYLLIQTPSYQSSLGYILQSNFAMTFQNNHFGHWLGELMVVGTSINWGWQLERGGIGSL